MLIRIAVVAAALGLLSGGPSAASADAACAAVIRWNGQTYEGLAVMISPVAGHRLETGVYPPCDDTPRQGEPAPQAQPARVRAMRGVSTHEAILEAGVPDAVYVRADLIARNRLPEGVKRLLRAPRCESVQPVRLAGRWLGILAAGGGTERDLVPPYDLNIHVRWASQRRYQRAFLDIRANSRTQGLITREDVDTALVGHTGDIWATVRCVRGRYVAVRLDARPT